MLAILAVIGTKYACNLSQDGDHIWAIQLFDPRRSLSRCFKNCRHIWSPTKLLLQAYLVPTLTDIAGIIGPPD